jgi:hypothetical protein
MHLKTGQALRFGNPVYHRKHRLTLKGSTAISVRTGVQNYAVTTLGLQHPEATATHFVLATDRRGSFRPTSHTDTTLDPIRRDRVSERQTRCINGAKHTGYNSELITARDFLSRACTNRNS